MKKCSNCELVLHESCFAQREDGWGLYAWCDRCRVKYKRVRVSGNQKEYIKKTSLFKEKIDE